jgi:hypothetical protein
MTDPLRRTLRRVCVLATILAMGSLILAALAPRAEAAVGFQKTLPVNPAELSDSKLSATLDLAQSAGVTQVQASATWWYLTRGGPRTYDWSSLDRLVDGAESRGMNVVLQLQGTPDWVHPNLASSVPRFGDRVWHPPVRSSAELGHWTDFVRDLAGRYRGRVSHYEIWNEQNWSHFWKPGPDVDEYARLLRAAHYALDEADPGATVVSGGLAFNDVGFLRAYYDSVDRQWGDEGAREGYFFDVLGTHPYSDNRSPRVKDPAYTHPGPYGEIDRNFLGFERLKQVMNARDSVPKRVYVGEYGFSTSDTWMRAVPDGTRAEYLRDAYALAAARNYVTGMAWYAYHPHNATGPEWAIVDGELNPSRTFEALRTAPSTQVPALITPGAGSTSSPGAAQAPSAPVDPDASVSDRRPSLRIEQVARMKYVAVLECGTERCAAVATGQLVALEREKRRFRTKARAAAEPGTSARMEVSIPRRAQKAAARALRNGGDAKAKVKVRAEDSAGEAVVKTRRLRIT